MYIQTEETPNPNALKFFPGVPISPEQPVHFSNLTEALERSELAAQLFTVRAVKAVFLGYDFITITKAEEADWLLIKPEILMIIMDYLVAGTPIFRATDNRVAPDLAGKSEIEKQIIEIIETRVRPSVAQDGGDIIYHSFQDGIVRLELRGSCSGCPSSTITLKNGIENMLKHFVPEVEAVEAIN